MYLDLKERLRDDKLALSPEECARVGADGSDGTTQGARSILVCYGPEVHYVFGVDAARGISFSEVRARLAGMFRSAELWDAESADADNIYRKVARITRE